MAIKRATGKSNFLNIEFEIEGEKQVSAAFDFVGEQLNDFTKPLTEIDKNLKQTWQNVFGNPPGIIQENWSPLSPHYALWKRQNYPGKGILIRTGKMKGNFKSSVTKLSNVHWNATSYFKFHQSNQPRNKIPRRVMMKLAPKQQAEIFREFTKYLNDVSAHFGKI